MNLPLPPADLVQVLDAITRLARGVRLTLTALSTWSRWNGAQRTYETVWLQLELDIKDARGERAVLTRRQRVRFLRGGPAVVRELVWGEGEQLIRYHARGARRLGLRAEGSRRAVLLEPERQPAAGDHLTITSRRTIRGGFREKQEYCEVYIAQPTGRADLTVWFPVGKPPTSAQLVAAGAETVLRTVLVRYSADGRAVLRCRLRRPDPAVTYSLRWTW